MIYQYIANHQLKDVGALASATAAKIYGLDVLAEDVQVNTMKLRKIVINNATFHPSTVNNLYFGLFFNKSTFALFYADSKLRTKVRLLKKNLKVGLFTADG